MDIRVSKRTSKTTNETLFTGAHYQESPDGTICTTAFPRFVLFLNVFTLSKIHIIRYSKWGRFCTILNSLTLSKMHYYWLLNMRALLYYFKFL